MEVMSEEGTIWAYDISIGDLSLNLNNILNDLSINSYNGEPSEMGDVSGMVHFIPLIERLP